MSEVIFYKVCTSVTMDSIVKVVNPNTSRWKLQHTICVHVQNNLVQNLIAVDLMPRLCQGAHCDVSMPVLFS